MANSMTNNAPGGLDQGSTAILQKTAFQRTKDDIQLLAAQLAQSKGFFAQLMPHSLELLCGLVGYQHVPEGGVVCKQGRHGDSMYIVLRGYCSVMKEPAQPATCDFAAGSRRSTLEQASQPYASRRSTMEQVPLAGGSRRSTVEQVALPFGSRRSTMEQAPHAAKEAVEPPKHIGWVAQGELINEAALVSAQRPYPNTVMAGDGGVDLVTLDRSAFNRLESQAGSQGSVAAAVQGIMAGCCRRVLQLPAQLRSADDVDTLAELLRHLEAFKRLPANVCQRLAKGCTFAHMPAGAVLFEEDSKADSMYVVVSGSCHVRARPLPNNTSESTTAAASSTHGAHNFSGHDASSAGFGVLNGPLGAARRRSTADAVLVGQQAGGVSARNSQAGAAAAASATGGGAVVGKGEGGRRRTWEEGAYTEEEQQRLDAILEALKADQEKDQRGLLKHSNAAEKAEKQVAHDSLYWMARYMQGARTNASAQDPNWGMEGGMTPLGAMYAVKWRQTVRDKQAVRLAQEKEQAEQEAQEAKVSGMEALLGKGAAKLWRRATTTDTDDAHTRQLDNAPAASGASSGSAVTGAAGTTGDAAAATASAAGAAPAGSDKLAGSGAQAFAAVVLAAMQAHRQEQQQEEQQQQQQQQEEQQEAADPNKAHMAALGAKDPANVSWALLAEIGRRSQLNEVLADVAKELTKKGLPKKLGQKACLKLTKELNKRILGGSSRQGLGLDRADDAAVGEGDEGGQQQQQQWEVGTEATGLAGDDWRSSLDGSESMSIASLDGYGERSVLGISGDSGTASPARYGSLSGPMAGDALFHGAIQQHSQHPQPQPAHQLTDAEAEARYGAVMRTITAGESIGELALLQRHATRTATLLVAGDAAPGEAASHSSGADLIRISQSCFDSTVRALQLAALEELLAFLGSLEPFKGLSRDRLTSLAIFCRPVKAGQGEVVVSAGAAVEALYLVQEGEVQLLGSCLPANTAPSAPLAPSRRLSMEQPGGSRQDSGSRYLIRQLSAFTMAPQGWPPAGRSRRTTFDPSDAAAPVSANQNQRNMASASAAPLAAMGPGNVFGENLLGYADDAEAPSSRQTAAFKTWQLQRTGPTHVATVVATKPCELLVVPAAALKRLASRIKEPLMGLAANRREFVQTRIGQLQDTKVNLAHAADGSRKELARNQRAAAMHYALPGAPASAGVLPSIHAQQPHPLAAARLQAQQQQQQQQQLPSFLAHKQDIFASDVRQMTQLVPQTTVSLAEAILRKSSVLAAPAAASSGTGFSLPPARTLSTGLPLPVTASSIASLAALVPAPVSATAAAAERTGALAPRPTSSALYSSAAFSAKLGSVGAVGGSLPASRNGSALPRSSGGGAGISSSRRSTGDRTMAGTNWLFQDALAAGGVVSAAGPMESSQGGAPGSSKQGRSMGGGMQQQQQQPGVGQPWQTNSGRRLQSAGP